MVAGALGSDILSQREEEVGGWRLEAEGEGKCQMTKFKCQIINNEHDILTRSAIRG